VELIAVVAVFQDACKFEPRPKINIGKVKMRYIRPGIALAAILTAAPVSARQYTCLDRVAQIVTLTKLDELRAKTNEAQFAAMGTTTTRDVRVEVTMAHNMVMIANDLDKYLSGLHKVDIYGPPSENVSRL
jgi:hypothetical protein